MEASTSSHNHEIQCENSGLQTENGDKKITLLNTSYISSTESSISDSESSTSSCDEENSNFSLKTTEDKNVNILPLHSALQKPHVLNESFLPHNESTVFRKTQIQSSENVKLGTFYRGQITINQYVYNNPLGERNENPTESEENNEYQNDNRSESRNETDQNSQYVDNVSHAANCIRHEARHLSTKRFKVIFYLANLVIISVIVISIWTVKNFTFLQFPRVSSMKIEVPSPPSKFSAVRQIYNNSVQIEWQKPINDGGIPLEVYKIDVKNINEKEWHTVTTVKSNVQQVVINGLRDNEKYIFRIYAKNMVGFSEPLQSDEPVVITSSRVEYLRLITREKWGALDPKLPPIKLKTLPSHVIICHIPKWFCTDSFLCRVYMASNQEFVIRLGHGDIDYNFVIGGDGFVYEGRGWSIEGNHTFGYNNRSIGIGLFGDFRYDEPTIEQIDATKKFLDYGVKKNKIAHDYKLLGHKQIIKYSNDPGANLYKVIQTWKHWSAQP